jgi:hypothetical protein
MTRSDHSPQATRRVYRNLLDIMERHNIDQIDKSTVARIINDLDQLLNDEGRKGQRVA